MRAEARVSLAETGTTMPLAEAGHCLSQRRDNTASRRGRKEVHITGRGVPFELTRIRWTHKPNARNGNAFQLARNSLDTLQPKDKRLLRVSRLHSGSL